MNEPEFRLPPALIGKAHLAQLIRELENVENDLEQQKARNQVKGVEADLHIPTMSKALSDCIELNQVDIVDSQQRMQFKKTLNVTKDKAPVMHFTFASDPDGESLQKLVDWVRTEIHPRALISVGLQPALVGGVYLRTPNHVHDFSLRTLLHGKRDIIVKELEALHER
jgi:F0F1-type ATP synthase delta subunit